MLELVVTPYQGGHVLSNGGSRFLTLSAGYLGSLGWGMAIYISAVRSQFDKHIMALLGLVIMAIAFKFIGNLFGLGFSVFIGLTLMGLGLKAPEKANDLILRPVSYTHLRAHETLR